MSTTTAPGSSSSSSGKELATAVADEAVGERYVLSGGHCAQRPLREEARRRRPIAIDAGLGWAFAFVLSDHRVGGSRRLFAQDHVLHRRSVKWRTKCATLWWTA